MNRLTAAVVAMMFLCPLVLAADTPEQLYEKGMAALSGQGPQRSDLEARKYMQQSAEAGYVPAEVTLGYFYEAGMTTAAEPGQALHWYKKAAESGDPLAEYLVGRMYLTGIATAVDKREAEKWLLKSASAGNPFAAYLLGVVEEDLDYRRAPEWYLKAAQQGLPQAQARYGKLLMDGRGIAVDKFNAYVWMVLAYDAGDASISDEISRLDALMTEEEVERAKIKAHEMQGDLARTAHAHGCTGWPGEFDAMPTPPPAEVQRFCR